MPVQKSLALRVKTLEKRVKRLEGSGRLSGLTLQIQQLRTELKAGFSAHDGRFTTLAGRFTTLEQKVDDSRTEMRVLHEEVISRIALIGEGAAPRKTATRRKEPPA